MLRCGVQSCPSLCGMPYAIAGNEHFYGYFMMQEPTKAALLAFESGKERPPREAEVIELLRSLA